MNRRVKLNNKGFMLAEVIVVSVVIIAVLVTLFTALNRLISAYNTRSTYYDIDAAYLAVEINNILTLNGSINYVLSKNKSGRLINILNQDDYMDYEENFLLPFNSSNFNIQEYLYIFSQGKDGLNNLKDSNSTNTFNDYIDYLKGHIDFSENYNYIIIVELIDKRDSNNCRYYALKVR